MMHLKNFSSIAKNWIRHGFFSYWKRLFCLLAIPLMILSVFLGIYLGAKKELDEKNYTTREFLTVCYKFNDIFDFINKNYLNIVQQREIEAYVINSRTNSNEVMSEITSDLRTLFNNTVVSVSYLEAIHFYCFDNDYVVSTRNGNPIEDFYNPKFYHKFKESGKAANITFENADHTPEVINLCYGYYMGTTLKGLVVFSVDVMDLKNELLLNTSGEERDFVLTDFDGFLYNSSDTIFSMEDLNKIAKDISYSDSVNIDFDKHEGRYIFKLKSAVSDVEMLYMRKEHGSSNHSYVWLSVFLILLINAIVIVSSLILARQLREQFVSIVSEFMEHFSLDENSDTEQLSKSIFDNLRSHEKLEIAFPRQMLNLRKTQFYALQMQLSPHFLYNTLNSVNLMAMRLTKSDNTISQLIVLLSELLYDVLDTKKYIVTLRKEIEYSRKFLEIENIKRKNLVEITWDIDEEFLEYGVIKFILQPVLENIFRHAFRAGQGQSRVDISAKNHDNDFVITIKDNGKGICEEELSEIRLKLSDESFEGRHIGLANVNKRIQMLYGLDYGLGISSVENEGTVIEIKLPIIKINHNKGADNHAEN